jgi:Zn-dependent protease with chaperone function
VPPLLAFVVFGALRVTAPVTLIGLAFEEPLEAALAGVTIGVAGAALLWVPPIERRVGRWLAPSREPTLAERERLAPMIRRIGERAGIRTDRLILRVQEAHEMNASAGAVHHVFLTTGALRRDDADLEALLAHELGHHRGLIPVATALIWWLSLPGLALAAVYKGLRALAARLTGRVRPLAFLVQILIVIWQVSVMWLYFIAQLLAMRAARVSEYVADRYAARWGYGDRLASLLASIDTSPPAGLIARLTETHPPTELRVERLRNAH